jgi:hypothetical protein
MPNVPSEPHADALATLTSSQRVLILGEAQILKENVGGSWCGKLWGEEARRTSCSAGAWPYPVEEGVVVFITHTQECVNRIQAQKLCSARYSDAVREALGLPVHWFEMTYKDRYLHLRIEADPNFRNYLPLQI